MEEITRTKLIRQLAGICSIWFFLVSLYSCTSKSNAELLVGKWKINSITDLDKNTTQNFQRDELVFLKITKDSIFEYENTFKDHPKKCGWKINNDSIFLTQNGYTFLEYKILELNEKELKVQNNLKLKSDGEIILKSNKIEKYVRLN